MCSHFLAIAYFDWSVVSSARPRTDFEIVIRGSRNSGKGTVAIDSISVAPGACPQIGNNNFESGFNTFTNTKSGDVFDWIVRKGGTPTVSTGPKSDHTLRSTKGKQQQLIITSLNALTTQNRNSANSVWLNLFL